MILGSRMLMDRRTETVSVLYAWIRVRDSDILADEETDQLLETHLFIRNLHGVAFQKSIG